MFEEDNRKGHLPGYTGHIPSTLPKEALPQSSPNKKHIPGYGGFVPKIKAENMFGESFGKTSSKSANNQCNIGPDVPPEEKYTSMAKTQFIDTAKVVAPSVAESVGVDKGKPTYKQPLPPENINKFFGVDYKDWNPSLQAKAFDNVSKDFFYNREKVESPAKKQNEEEAAKLFFGIPDKKTVKLGEPLPGYQGFNKRIVADNIYGNTYQMCKTNAKDSDFKVHETERDELKKTGKINSFKN